MVGGVQQRLATVHHRRDLLVVNDRLVVGNRRRRIDQRGLNNLLMVHDWLGDVLMHDGLHILDGRQDGLDDRLAVVVGAALMRHRRGHMVDNGADVCVLGLRSDDHLGRIVHDGQRSLVVAPRADAGAGVMGSGAGDGNQGGQHQLYDGGYLYYSIGEDHPFTLCYSQT